ncbi:RING-H2 finger protein ATL52-like [Octopus vulgaris]|uniref:RING-H2 finger protein ATL52-like n=1 Tax=Octopus vulgaris TaxID=6645 RepID=A0AA36AH56_OCTVU|nr:RING-H2 finger protein ATL52-like [Octopus vulgaris]
MASGFSVKIYRSPRARQTTRSDGSKKCVACSSKIVYMGFLSESSRNSAAVKSRNDCPLHGRREEMQPSIVSSIYNGGGDNICSICCDSFRMGENMEILSACLHKYHSPCLAEWLKKKRNCPTCRSKC